MKAKLFFTVVVFSALTVIATGQTSQPAQQVQPGKGQEKHIRNGQGRPCGMTYGPCKEHPRRNGMMAVRGQGRGQGQGQGTAQGRDLHNGQGQAFVDVNKDGVCDNLLTTASEKK